MADPPRIGWTSRHDELARAEGHDSWAAWCEAVEAEKGYKICGGMNTQKAPCRKKAGAPSPGGKPTGHAGHGRCGAHGGLSLSGPYQPQWKDGRAAKATTYRVGGKLAETMDRLAVEVQDAFDLTAEARLAHARMVQIVEELRDGGHVTGSDLAEIRDGIRQAVRSADPMALQTAISSLDALVARAGRGDASWREWGRLADLKRKLGDTHARQQAKDHGPVHWPDLVYLLDGVAAWVEEFVPAERRREARDRLRKFYPSAFDPTGPPDLKVVD